MFIELVKWDTFRVKWGGGGVPRPSTLWLYLNRGRLTELIYPQWLFRMAYPRTKFVNSNYNSNSPITIAPVELKIWVRLAPS